MHATKATIETLEKCLPMLRRLPEDLYFVLKENSIEFLEESQAAVERIRAAFPAVWKRTWSDDHEWWEYSAEFGGLRLRIYTVKEAPARCKAITEKRIIKKKVPIEFEEVEEEVEVVVGWDCNGGAEKAEEPGAPPEPAASES